MNRKILSLAFLSLYASFAFCMSIMPFQMAMAESSHCMSEKKETASIDCCEEIQEVFSQDAYFSEGESDIVFSSYDFALLLEHFVLSDITDIPFLSNIDPPPDTTNSYLTQRKSIVLIR